jgi:hypothetical protein
LWTPEQPLNRSWQKSSGRFSLIEAGLSLPRSQSFNTGCIDPENHGEGEGLGNC